MPIESPALAEVDAYSAAKATAPRVSVKDMESRIASEHYINAGEAALGRHAIDYAEFHSLVSPLYLLTLCFLTLDNGFTVVGKSAPASPENFDEEKGRRFAYEDAIRQLWPMMGFMLCEDRHRAAQIDDGACG